MQLELVACRSEFITADALGRCCCYRTLLLSAQGFASVTVTADAESGNGCSATCHLDPLVEPLRNRGRSVVQRGSQQPNVRGLPKVRDETS